MGGGDRIGNSVGFGSSGFVAILLAHSLVASCLLGGVVVVVCERREKKRGYAMLLCYRCLGYSYQIETASILIRDTQMGSLGR